MDLNLLVILLASLARSVRSGGEGSLGWRTREAELPRESRVTRETREEGETSAVVENLMTDFLLHPSYG